jgi:siroheme decarboxylase
MKVRSRTDGAARRLDDVERQLLNLLQGSFPLARRPFAAIGALAGIPEAEVIARTRQLLADRIIRQLTPIYDTRALGYASMLVAAKVDPEVPWRAATAINSHPGVSHNYLRDHEFNLWFTIAVAEDSRLGMHGTLAALQQLSGATAMRQLPTLRLFKIRMDLEMEGGTERLTATTPGIAPAETERQPFDEFDRAVIRATQGDLDVCAQPYAPAAAALGISQDRLLEHMQEMVDRRLLRRVAAILFHRRAGFSANGMGVWQVPPGRIDEIGHRMASFRGVSHCYERPTYEDWPYQIFTMAHGRSKAECDAVLDAIDDEVGCVERRATLYSSTEFKKVRLRYFTDEFARWEAAHA